MKKLMCVLLAVVMLAGLGVGAVAAIDPEDPTTWPEIVLDEPADMEWDSEFVYGTFANLIFKGGYVGYYSFVPQDSGWYNLEVLGGQSFNNSQWLIEAAESADGRLIPSFMFQLINMSNQLVQCYENLINGANVNSLSYLEKGKGYQVGAIAVRPFSGKPDIPDGTIQALIKKADVTGSGNVQPINVTSSVGGYINIFDIFPVFPSYPVLRVNTVGDAVDSRLVPKKAGISTLIFYDWDGNEVGRCTVTVEEPALTLKWWQSLPTFLQFLLRWLAFGWFWMR